MTDSTAGPGSTPSTAGRGSTPAVEGRPRRASGRDGTRGRTGRSTPRVGRPASGRDHDPPRGTSSRDRLTPPVGGSGLGARALCPRSPSNHCHPEQEPPWPTPPSVVEASPAKQKKRRRQAIVSGHAGQAAVGAVHEGAHAATRGAAKKSADREVRPVRSSGEHESPEFSVGAGGETHQTVEAVRG